MSEFITPYGLDFQVIDGRPFTTSLVVAQKFKKNHADVLKAIRKLECSQSFRLSNFAESSYLNNQNKLQPLFRMNDIGFSFLVTGFTGKPAAEWKEKFILAFRKMETFLREQQFILNWDSKGKLPNELKPACEILAQIEDKIITGQKFMKNLRAARKRTNQHVLALSKSPVPPTPEFIGEG